jgi:ketosteroid isomerase-like protein
LALEGAHKPALAQRRGALAGLVVLAFVGCARSDPERELRETIATMARAIEARDPVPFLDAIADDFTRESGAFGRQDVKRVLVGIYMRNEKINLAAVVTDLKIEGNRAQARVRVVATGGSGLLPERGQTWEFESAWRRDSGKWRVFNAEWREGL